MDQTTQDATEAAISVFSVVDPLADLAAILTAVFATWIWLTYVWGARARRKALEDYLKLEREADDYEGKGGLRSILHLMANLAMTEEQIYSAVFSSSVIRTWTVPDDDGRTTLLMFQYEAKAVALRKRDKSSREKWVERLRSSKSSVR